MPRQAFKELDTNASTSEQGGGEQKKQDTADAHETETKALWEVGTFVDAKFPKTGTWHTAKVIQVLKDENKDIKYSVKFTEYEEHGEYEMMEVDIRNITKIKLELMDIEVGATVLSTTTSRSRVTLVSGTTPRWRRLRDYRKRSCCGWCFRPKGLI